MTWSKYRIWNTKFKHLVLVLRASWKYYKDGGNIWRVFLLLNVPFSVKVKSDQMLQNIGGTSDKKECISIILKLVLGIFWMTNGKQHRISRISTLFQAEITFPNMAFGVFEDSMQNVFAREDLLPSSAKLFATSTYVVHSLADSEQDTNSLRQRYDTYMHYPPLCLHLVKWCRLFRLPSWQIRPCLSSGPIAEFV